MILQFFLHLFTNAALADTIPLEVGIGTLGSITSDYPLLDYIKELYKFSVSAIGIIAAAMIMFNGLRWAAAAGNQEAITSAKSGIVGAVVGLILSVTSYVILNTINPGLTTFQPLDITELEFVEPVTTSVAALDSGNIADDETLQHYMDLLPASSLAVLENQASEPYITASTYTALSAALTELANPSSPYHGMKLVIAGANRTLTTAQHLWDCYQKKKTENVCPTGCNKCSQAAVPGTSLHMRGNALDVSWKNTGTGTYVTTTGYANSDYHDECVVPTTRPTGCSTDIYNSIVALNTMMQSAGFSRICIEWWHHQVGGSSASICSPGSYQ